MMNRTQQPLQVAAAVLILLSALVLGAAWRDHGRFAVLRAEQAALRERAEQSGFPQEGEEIALPAKLAPRPDPEMVGRRVATSFLAHAREMEALDEGTLDRPDKALREKMIARIDEVKRLNGRQLRILMGEVLDSGEIDERQQEDLIAYIFPRMERKDPREAFEILLERPLLGTLSREGKAARKGWLGSAMREWAEREPQAALAWLREHSEDCEEVGSSLQALTRAAIYGTSRTNPRLAMDLAREQGLDSTAMVTDLLADCARTPEQRAEALVLLREWTAGTAEAAEVWQKPVADLMRSLAWKTTREGYEPTMAWIEAQNFSPQELAAIAEPGFNYPITYPMRDEDRGRWAEWLAKVLPTESARKPIREVVDLWFGKNPAAAERWLGELPEGVLRRVATGVMAERKIYTEPQEAQQLALSLPEGVERASVLVRLYRNWPGGSEEARVAAERMADAYGVAR